MVDYHNKLFQPIQIGRHKAQNRIEIAPAGAFLNNSDGSGNEKFRAYMKDISRSGAGIVTVGVSDINKQPLGGKVPWLANPGLISEYAEITEIMHIYGCLASIELVPVRQMLSPGFAVATQSSREEIRELIDEYAKAADFCLKAGFDMIMIHGGHGNVPGMFFSEKYNKRNDEYGGSFENRCRFGEELLDAVRREVGDKLAIEYRISAEELTADGMGIEETLNYTKKIQDKIDLLHISRGLLEEDSLLPYIFSPAYFPRALNLEAAKVFKKELSIPVSVVGGFNLDLAAEVVEQGDVDMVAMMRNMLADPLCIRKAKAGNSSDIRPCVRCNTCINETHSKMLGICCAVNPEIGRETWYSGTQSKAGKKKVVMVGGGPGNLEAARTAADRGHQVVILEKEKELGGALRMACAAEFKADLKKYLDWSVYTVMNHKNIRVCLNTNATANEIHKENPDAVFLGIGSKPILPAFTASKSGKVVWVGDVELKKAETGSDVIVVGAGFTGMEAALALAREGKKVRIIDMIPESRIGADGVHISIIGLKKLLLEAGVTFICEVKLEDVTEEGAIISRKDISRELLTCDTVVLSLGVRTDEEEVEALSHLVEETYILGDCARKGGTLYNAVKMGHALAMDL
ncbi:FAD-dependent oxidoreductase [Clostridium sp. E02]|uniref:oxidoreductase n=1 Tax=Clostridium sp. E02 TaxID=2487134 RepID=UPI001FAACE41|nr:FAD-dependent oxidoreductase [Clostridium sp. E02]